MFTTRLRALSVFVVLAAAGSGLLLAQSPQAVGTWVGVGTADNPFGNGASVALSDGRTLIVGGAGPDGAATNVVSSFDTAANQFAIAGTLLNARIGHTVTLLKDGRVLVTGGTADSLLSTEIELFDPSTGSSTLVAQMPEPRRSHVAALLQNGSVLIAGGYTTGDVVLQSAFIFDPATNAVSPTPAGLSVARASASATTLIDGRVAIIGGTDGTNDLRSAEIFDATLQSFTTASTQLTVPVRGHSAVLLPNNGSVLIAGGTSNGAAQAGAELFLPAEFPDPFSWGIGQFAATAPMNAARSGAVAGPSATEGYAVVTGGGSNSVERYRFATIKTDKDDYAPGEHALITGTGWQPAEQVTLTFQEDPAVHDDYVLTLTADEQGKISTHEWAPEQHDLNVRFYLTASGSRSKAQTTFTDGLRVTVQRDAPPAAALTVAHGSTTSVRFKIENNNNGGDSSTSITVNYTLTAAGSVVASAAPLTGTVTLPNNGASVLRSWDVTAGGPPFTGTVTLMATIVSPACSPGGSNACSSSADYTFTITPPPPPTDSTPPVINPSIAGTLGLNGWYTSDVTVSWKVTDLESAIGSSTGCATTTLGTDTAGTTITCSATSAGGTSTQSVTIKRDATAPTISSSRTPANSYGWNNAAVTVSFTCFDATSGLAAGSPPVDTTVSTEGGNQSVGGMCTDLAGNSASATVNDINIDTTVPSISAGRLPAANGTGWNNTDVVASYNASDALSGLVESATGTYTFELEAAGQEHP
ncbi:MAG TPA: kelch repeat-containing protein, partial [Vicinamibacterales bacterium]|nr:kelch repeat-containing protein [Vicinamibacterales bacterium]